MANKKLKVGNVPNLRFPEFEGEWEQVELGDITEKINSGKTPLGGESNYLSEGIVFIRSQNVINNQLEIQNSVFISKKVNAGMKNSIVKANDILLNITGASLGRSCVVPSDFTIGNVNQHVCIIRTKERYNPRFIQPILSSVRGQALFGSLQTGSGREGLNFENIKQIELYLPTCNEQSKIAEFLTLIDNRIQTQSKIIEGLKLLKNTFSKKLFSRKLRFKDFRGNDFFEWEVKKLRDLGTFFSGGTPLTSKKKYFNGNIPFIRSGEINLDKTEQFLSEEGLKNSSAKMINIGDLIYALYGATSGEVSISKINGAINQAILCIRSSVNNTFLMNYLLLQKKHIIKTYLQGGQGNLSAEIIKSLNVPIPDRDEQTKITDLLSSINTKIEIENQLLQKLDEQKKFLLQNLFCLTCR